MTSLDPMTVDPTRPQSWPVMDEEQARQVLTGDMRVVDAVPVSWWGKRHEVLVATHDVVLALRTADVLARRDVGVGYSELVDGPVGVDGPHRVVLVGWPGSGHVEWAPADEAAPYVLYVCRVRPGRARLTLTADQAAGGDLALFLAAEDAAEDAGLLGADDRRTCHTCRAWATGAHVTSPGHLAATFADPQYVAAWAATRAPAASVEHETTVEPALAPAPLTRHDWRCSCGAGSQGAPLSKADAELLARIHRDAARYSAKSRGEGVA
jgi:hypothetical protein